MPKPSSIKGFTIPQMRLFSVIASIIFGSTFSALSQPLIINEVSQGTGTKEYVEFIVAGMPTCLTPVPCVDLRGVIIDDNNGNFASGPGTGIAPGAVRFANNAFWSCIPQGTIIVVYNDLDRNTAIPPDDLTMNDGNCKLIIPVNSNLFEGQSVGPTINDPNYPANASWIAGAGSWNQIAMANSDDSFCVMLNNINSVPYFSVSWGNNTNFNAIYFSGSASGKVFSLTNNNNDNIFLGSNWTSGSVGVNETPGVPNSAQNQAWIGAMNPTCYGVTPLDISFNVTPSVCGSNCSGGALGTVTGGASPYTYSWSTGATSNSIANLCPGNYSLTVTDQNGCSYAANTTIAAGQTPPSSVFNAPGTHLLSDGVILIPSNGMGTWTSECGACLSANGVFDPAVSGTGTFEVCYSTAAGICTSTTCNDITITNGCADQESFVNLEICEGENPQLNGETFTNPGQYEQHFTLAGGCDSALYITVFQCINTDYTLEIPNVITPNSDNVNDLWTVDYSGLTFENGAITNRWGQVIQALSAPIIVWDGKNSDTVCSEGVYFYQLKFKTVTGEIIEKQGFIQLYR